MPNFKWSEVVSAIETAVEKGELDSRYGFIISAISHSEHDLSAVCDPLQVSSSWLVRVARSVCGVPGKEGDCDNDKLMTREIIREFTNLGWLEVYEESDAGSVGLTYCRVTIPARYRCELGSVEAEVSQRSTRSPSKIAKYYPPKTALGLTSRNDKPDDEVDADYISSLIMAVGLRAFIGEESFRDFCDEVVGHADVVAGVRQGPAKASDSDLHWIPRSVMDTPVFDDPGLLHLYSYCEFQKQQHFFNYRDACRSLQCDLVELKSRLERLSEIGAIHYDTESTPNIVRIQAAWWKKYPLSNHSNGDRPERSKKQLKRAAKSLEVSNDLEKLGQELDSVISKQGEVNGSDDNPVGF